MRRIARVALPEQTARYLNAKQSAVEADTEIDKLWKQQRRSASMRPVEAALRRMAGPRERCMYCEDSRGTDIEHFWPRVPYRERLFLWPNLLWSCAGCNRCKTKNFPLTESGAPLLIDPTSEDPWDHLFYDEQTHEITPRWDPNTGLENPKGEETLAALPTLRYQAVTEGRGRTQRNLKRAVASFLESKIEDEEEALAELWRCLTDNDGYGLLVWYFLRDGRHEQPFAGFRGRKPAAWAEIARRVSQTSAPSTAPSV